MGIVAEGVGPETVEAITPAEEEVPLVVLKTPVEVVFIALQAIIRVEVFEPGARLVEAGKPPVGAQPEALLVVFKDAVDRVVGQAVLGGIGHERFNGAVEAVEPAAGAQPEPAVVVFEEGKHHVVAETPRISRIVAKGRERLGFRLEPF